VKTQHEAWLVVAFLVLFWIVLGNAFYWWLYN
jgi:hypothetical protein